MLHQQRENNSPGSKSKQVGYLNITEFVEHVVVVLQKLQNCKIVHFYPFTTEIVH